MSLPTPETLPRHELVGLRVEVVDAPNPDLVGTAGRVVGETTNTLHVESGSSVAGSDGGASRVRQVPKSGSTFEFALTDEAAAGANSAGTASELPSETTGSDTASPAGQSGGCDDVAYGTVDGARLLSRPARRTETGGVSKWR
jgi:ribonuclease P protein subunit POP4